MTDNQNNQENNKTENENSQEIAQGQTENIFEKALDLVEGKNKKNKSNNQATDNQNNNTDNNNIDNNKKGIVILFTDTYVILGVDGNGEKIQRTNNNPIKIGEEIYLSEI